MLPFDVYKLCFFVASLSLALSEGISTFKFLNKLFMIVYLKYISDTSIQVNAYNYKKDFYYKFILL